MRLAASPLFLSLVLLAGTGCATMSPRAHVKNVRFEPFGEAGNVSAQTAALKQTLAQALEAAEPEQLATMAQEVRVLEKSLPDGVELRDGSIKVDPRSGLEVLGSFAFHPAFGSTLWFSDYSSVGRKLACWPQVPLTWATVMLWQYLVPVAYPCIAPGALPSDQGLGMVRMIGSAAGADLVILTKTQRTETTLGAASGLLLRRRKEEPPRPRAGEKVL